MIPANIDVLVIIEELNGVGWVDQKIEIACGFSGGYIGHIRAGNIKELSYARAARLHNFWLSEVEANRAST